MNELVTIGISFSNVENYLDFSIKSVLNQTYTNWELILTDDGSTDRSLDVVKKSGIGVQSIDVNQGSKDKGTKLRLLVRIPNTVDIASIAREIKASGHVGKVEIKEKY